VFSQSLSVTRFHLRKSCQIRVYPRPILSFMASNWGLAGIVPRHPAQRELYVERTASRESGYEHPPVKSHFLGNLRECDKTLFLLTGSGDASRCRRAICNTPQ